MMSARKVKGPAAAKACGVRHQTFYGWLSGSHVPPRTAAERLAKCLKRPDLIALIDQDRVDHRRAKRRAERLAAPAVAEPGIAS